MAVPFFRAGLDGRELEYIQKVLESGWLTSGPWVQEFEDAFAAAVGADHAIAVNSCTAALHLACKAARVGDGSEVLVPSLTFTATAEVVENLGGRVRIVDVDPTTGHLTPELLADALDSHPSISCVMPVHFAGSPCRMLGTRDLPGIVDLCHARGITIVEDAAHAFTGNYSNGKPIGSSIGTTACCFSFYANKAITAGEGGMVTTDDPAAAERIRRLRLHGIDRSSWDRQTRVGTTWEYDVVETGFKYNLTDLAAAIGLAQLERSQEFLDARRRLASRYHERLSELDGLRLPPQLPDSEHDASHLFVVHTDASRGVDRNTFIDGLARRGIGTSVHYRPLHRMTHWKRSASLNPNGYPGADAWFEGCVSLPLFPTMTDQEFEAVIAAVSATLADSRAATA